MTLVKWNNNIQKPLLPGFNDVFDSVFNDTFFNDRTVARVPAVNISESEASYHIELAVPGLKKEDFKLNLEKNLLTISADQTNNEEDQQKTYSIREYNYSSFIRSFTLPDTADNNNINATYRDGMLYVDIAKREEAKSISKQIEIK